jgi:hypothetical protein
MPDGKKQLSLLLLLAWLLIGGPLPGAVTADAERGLEAYRAGNTGTALAILGPAAEHGDAEAQYILGAIYLEDRGVSPDLPLSTRWYRAAAVQGHIEAQFSLGNAYLNGRGVEVDLSAARSWWSLAARAGSAESCLNLGVHHIRDAAHPPRMALGRAWLQRAMALGSTRAATYLGMLEGPARDPAGATAGSRDWNLEPLRSEAELLVSAPESVTIQFLSSASREVAQAFIERHALGDRARLFRLPKDKQLLWNVVYGEYRSRTDAVSTLETLRPELRKADPWPRLLSEVQAAVRSVWVLHEGLAAEFMP